MTNKAEVLTDAGDSIRNDVLKHMHERNVSAWQLSLMCGVPYDTVRRFVAGTNDTSTTKASMMLAALTQTPTSETTN